LISTVALANYLQSLQVRPTNLIPRLTEIDAWFIWDFILFWNEKKKGVLLH